MATIISYFTENSNIVVFGNEILLFQKGWFGPPKGTHSAKITRKNTVKKADGNTIKFEIKDSGIQDAKEFETDAWKESHFRANFFNAMLSRDSFMRVMKNEKGDILGAMVMDNKPKILNNEKSLEISVLETSPHERKRKTQGIGTSMILDSIDISQKKGYKGRITLTPSVSSRGFYEKMGFKEVTGGRGTWKLDSTNAQNLSDLFGE